MSSSVALQEHKPLDHLRLGFVGTGTITAAIVQGLRTNGTTTPGITVSPRNGTVAKRLTQEYSEVRIAPSNQAVLDASDVVVLAVRPQIALDVITQLRFRADHRIISLVATFSHARIMQLVAPAPHAVCAVPMPTAQAQLSPTPIYPPDAVAAALFDRVGVAIEVKSEAELQALWASSAVMASFFTLLQTLSAWLIDHGVAPSRARAHVAMMFDGLARVPASSDAPFALLAAEFQTKGGLNEQCATELAQKGAFKAWSVAVERVLARIQGKV